MYQHRTTSTCTLWYVLDIATVNLGALEMSAYVSKNDQDISNDLFVARIFGAKNVHTTFPTHYVAAVAHDLDGRANLHASADGYRDR